MYFVFVIKNRHNSVSRGNSKITRKEMSNLYRCDYLTIRQNVAREERKRKKSKKMMNFDYYDEYLTSISNKILLWQC